MLTRQAALWSPWYATSSAHRSRSLTHALCLFFVVCYFLPYPALAIGANTGLEASELLAVALLPFILLIGLPSRHLTVLLLLVIPGALSAAIAVVSGDAESSIVAVRALFFGALQTLVLLPAGWVARRINLATLLAAVSLALIGHAMVGAYQVYAFSHGWFPLARLYRNPTYASMADVSDVYVQYVKRPFGLFPEPSAMAAAIGPWVVVMTGLLLYPALPRRRLTRRLRLLMTIAVAASLVLIVWSQTGFTVPLIVILVVVSLPWIRRTLSEYFLIRRVLTIAIVLIVAVFVAELTVARLGKRLNTPASNVWGDRKTSIEVGLTIPVSSPTALLVGVGPGQSTLRLQQSHGLGTIWSVTIRNVAETGLIGLITLLGAFGLLLRVIWRSSARWLGLCALITLAIAVTLVTSYGLAAIWLFIAVLLIWDHIFPPRPASPSRCLSPASLIWRAS